MTTVESAKRLLALNRGWVIGADVREAAGLTIGVRPGGGSVERSRHPVDATTVTAPVADVWVASLGHDRALGLVRNDLPLDALEGVVDRLAVAVELLCHPFVRAAVEVEAKRLGLERRERRAKTADE